jgi:hypothetical protein
MSKKNDASTSHTHGQATAKAKTNLAATAGPVIEVFDVEELYAAVDDPANEGASIFLQPKRTQIYELSEFGASGGFAFPRSNGGRLHLQKDMKLYGVIGDPDAITIDTRNLPAESLSDRKLRLSAIAVGSGNNVIEWLTILGNAQAAGSIGTDLPGTDPTTVRIAHVKSGEGTNSSRGVDIRNLEKREVTVEIEECEFFGQKQGIRLANFEGSDGAQIIAALSGNSLHENSTGCLVANNGANESRIEVRSKGGWFDGNAAGCVIAGGLARATGTANKNFTRFEAFESQFSHNRFTPPDFQVGGFVVFGGEAQNNPGNTSNNTVEVWLEDCTIAKNQSPNFAAWGARNKGTQNRGIAGRSNSVTIELYGSSASATVEVCDSDPAEPDDENTVSVKNGQIIPGC